MNYARYTCHAAKIRKGRSLYIVPCAAILNGIPYVFVDMYNKSRCKKNCQCIAIFHNCICCRYVRDNDDKALRRQAERIHLQTSSSSSVNLNSTNSTAINASETSKTSPANSEPQASTNTTQVVITIDNNGVGDPEYIKIEEEKSNSMESEKNAKDGKNNQGDEDDDDDYRAHGDDKLTWDDVDKDLGDILRESEAGASKSSDDEDSRYDRFRNSDKKQQSGKEKESEKSEVLEEKSGNNKIKDLKVKAEKTDM